MTFAEIARREQLIRVTIEVIAERGAARTSLQSIADAASITKAAVLYHFGTKNDLIKAAYEFVRTALTTHVAQRIEAAPSPGAAVGAYLRGILDYIATHPTHVGLMIESLTDPGLGIEDRSDRAARWRPLAELICQAQRAGQYASAADPRMHAIILGGAVDALIGETLSDDTFSLREGADSLLDMVHTLASVQTSTSPTQKGT